MLPGGAGSEGEGAGGASGNGAGKGGGELTWPGSVRPYLPKSAWAAVDWSRPDGELASLLGMTRQAVSYQRHRRGRGSGRLTHPAEHFRRWVAANKAALHGLPSRVVADRFAAETGVAVRQSTALKGLRAAGVPKYRTPQGSLVGPGSKLAGADWRLPSRDLAAIWGLASARVLVRPAARGRPGSGGPAARRTRPARCTREALAAEQKKAKAAQAEEN